MDLTWRERRGVTFKLNLNVTREESEDRARHVLTTSCHSAFEFDSVVIMIILMLVCRTYFLPHPIQTHFREDCLPMVFLK